MACVVGRLRIALRISAALLVGATATIAMRAFESPEITQFWDPLTAAGRAALDAVITQQAQIIAYIDDYKLLMIATLAVIPLLIVFKQASNGGDGENHAIAME